MKGFHMSKKYVNSWGKVGTFAGVGLGLGAGLLLGPAGIPLVWLGLSGAGAGAGVGGALGLLTGSIGDEVKKNARARVIQIFGPKQTGKNSVYGTIINSNIKPSPTAPGTNKRYNNNKKTDISLLNGSNEGQDIFLDVREIAGEDPPTWEEVIIETNPHGIIYVVDSFTTTQIGTSDRDNKIQLEIEGISSIERALRKINNTSRSLKAFLILLNKIDLWKDDPSDLANSYRSMLLNKVIEGSRLDTRIHSLLGEDRPIRVQPFCAEWEKRSNYIAINQSAISTFNQDLHTR
jgi:hypothetical protein